jgi:hypothetical protein
LLSNFASAETTIPGISRFAFDLELGTGSYAIFLDSYIDGEKLDQLHWQSGIEDQAIQIGVSEGYLDNFRAFEKLPEVLQTELKEGLVKPAPIQLITGNLGLHLPEKKLPPKPGIILDSKGEVYQAPAFDQGKGLLQTSPLPHPEYSESRRGIDLTPSQIAKIENQKYQEAIVGRWKEFVRKDPKQAFKLLRFEYLRPNVKEFVFSHHQNEKSLLFLN